MQKQDVTKQMIEEVLAGLKTKAKAKPKKRVTNPVSVRQYEKIKEALKGILAAETSKTVKRDVDLVEAVKAKGVFATETMVYGVRRRYLIQSPTQRKYDLWEKETKRGK